MYVSPIREPLIKGNKTYSQITKDIAAPIEGKPGKAWYMGISLSLSAMFLGLAMMGWTIWEGIGTGAQPNHWLGLGYH